MVNPYRGQVAVELGGAVRTLALPMDRLAALEDDIGMGFFVFAARVSGRQATIRQLQAALYHGLLGGGWKPEPGEVKDPRGAVMAMMKGMGAAPCIGIVAELVSRTMTVGIDDEEPEGNPEAGEAPA
jgi:hypothetical protein